MCDKKLKAGLLPKILKVILFVKKKKKKKTETKAKNKYAIGKHTLSSNQPSFCINYKQYCCHKYFLH